MLALKNADAKTRLLHEKLRQSWPKSLFKCLFGTKIIKFLYFTIGLGREIILEKIKMKNHRLTLKTRENVVD